MTTTYIIENRVSAVILGTFKAETPRAALDQLARDTSSYDTWGEMIASIRRDRFGSDVSDDPTSLQYDPEYDPDYDAYDDPDIIVSEVEAVSE